MNEEVGWQRLESRAKAAFDDGDFFLARELLVEASEAVHAGPAVLANLGLVCLNLDDYPGAIHAYSSMSSMGVDERVNRGLAYGRLGQTESARADYHAALILDPDDVCALINLVTLELAAEKVDIARPLLERAYAIDPTAGWQLSDALRAVGDDEAAIVALDSAARAGESRALLDLAEIQCERGDTLASEAAYAAAAAAGLLDGNEDRDDRAQDG